MAKRKRNDMGQFVSNFSMDNDPKSLQEELWKKTIQIFMVIFLLFMVSPWVTIALKSKSLKFWINSIVQFYSKHFVGDDEINDGYACSKTPKDI